MANDKDLNKAPVLLRELTLRNYAIFKFQKITFIDGLNAIIGETGSGKSLIFEALQVLLGQRAQKEIIRTGHEFALLEAQFKINSKQMELYFQEIGHPCENGMVYVKRIIPRNGAAKNYLNFTACGLGQLTQVGEKFVDFVGQFANQKLLSPLYQCELLDHYQNLIPLKQALQKNFQQLHQLQKELSQLEERLLSPQEQIEDIQQQLSILNRLRPTAEGELRLNNLKKNYKVRQEVGQTLLEFLNLLTSTQHGQSFESQLKKTYREILKSSDLPESLLDNLQELSDKVDTLSFQISQILEDFESDINIEEILENLNLYQKLKSQHQTDADGLALIRENLTRELERLPLLEQEMKLKRQSLSSLQEKINGQADQLTEKRKRGAKILGQKVTHIISGLNLKGAKIELKVSPLPQVTPHGQDQVELLAQFNPGDQFRPVRKCASGGELSRVLLAFRQALNRASALNVFLFDEIDTGISGKTAKRIGESLKELAEKSQIIVVTHLPGIAQYAHQLIVVDKQVVGETPETHSEIKQVIGQKKKEAIQSMVVL